MTPILDHILRRSIGRIVHKGSLTLIAPSGQRTSFGDGTGEPVTVRLTDKRAVLTLLTDPDMRLGELYMDGRFVVEQGSIYDFVYLMLREAQNRSHPLPARLIDRARASLRRFRLRNLPARSKRNVAHHYDLDGRLYSLFLDADRQYS